MNHGLGKPGAPTSNENPSRNLSITSQTMKEWGKKNAWRVFSTCSALMRASEGHHKIHLIVDIMLEFCLSCNASKTTTSSYVCAYKDTYNIDKYS